MKASLNRQRQRGVMTALSTGLLLSALPAFAEPPLPATTESAVSDELLESTLPEVLDPTFATPTPAPESTLSRSGADMPVESSVVLRLQERRVYLYSGEMLVSSYPVAVGTDKTPTPQGEFSVAQMVVNPVWQSPWTGEVHQPGPDSALGVRWIGFADSAAGSFGFHGTPTIESIGTAASNGCVRMYNEDVVALFAQVDVGTPVIVKP